MKFKLLLGVVFMVFYGCNTARKISSTDNQYLKVLNYNIHHANPPSVPGKIDLEAIAKEINALNPDLVALQEVDIFTGRSGKDLHQANELGKLTGMTAYFFKAIDYDGGEYGLAILSRYPVSKTELIRLPTAEGTRGEPRILAVAEVSINGKTLIFANTHLDAQRNDTNRLLQINAIAEYFKKTDEKKPVIIAGDFNATPESQVVTVLDSIFTRSCVGVNCGFTIPQVNPVKTIDYIAYRSAGRLELNEHKVISTADYASDHLPVFASFKLN